ncbi:sensor histidine kinase [Rugosimonospora africana]|nr:HAMP domain-containing sensor histidine kinase [Rugosimonospora africana]
MVVAIATLAAIGIVVTDVAGMLLLRGQLIHRIDAQLQGEQRLLSRNGLNRNAVPPARRGPFGPDARFLGYHADGTPVAKPSADDPDLGGFTALKAHAGTDPYTVNSWRVMVTYLPDTAFGPGYLVSAVSLADVQSTEDELLLIDVPVSALVLVLIGFAAATVVRIGLRPLTRMEQTAAEIAAGNLHHVALEPDRPGGARLSRVDDADPHTESGRLGTALNGMLGQIESALAARTASEQRLRQFLADASHELRTPLTSIQGFAELYRRGGAPPGPALDEAMGRIESEVSRMRLLVGDLLLLARVDEERPLEQHPVDLLEVAADAVRDAHVRVPTRFVGLGALDDSYDTFEPVTVLGDEPRLRQVVTNLVANALAHTPDDARVEVRVGRPLSQLDASDWSGSARLTPRHDPDQSSDPPVAAVGAALPPGEPVAALEVVDTGPGMSPEDARRAFERLYRADPSRVRHQPGAHGGAGLGLSIVAAIVQAHGGRVELWTAPGEGARFRVLLPAQPDPDDEPIAEDDPATGAEPITEAEPIAGAEPGPGDEPAPGDETVAAEAEPGASPELQGSSEQI